MSEKVIQIALAELVKDFNLYPRHKVESYHVTEMVDTFHAGTRFPPIIIDRKSKRIIDGFSQSNRL